MPYIKQELRASLLAGEVPETDGELNFTITALMDTYINQHGLSYKTLNELVGVLECAKLELYRRLAAPYEDRKMRENGDVYTS